MGDLRAEETFTDKNKKKNKKHKGALCSARRSDGEESGGQVTRCPPGTHVILTCEFRLNGFKDLLTPLRQMCDNTQLYRARATRPLPEVETRLCGAGGGWGVGG